MGCYWIVSEWKFHEHKSVGSAFKERERLAGLHPEKTFRIYRVKTSLKKSNATAVIKALEKRNAKLVAALELARRHIDDCFVPDDELKQIDSALASNKRANEASAMQKHAQPEAVG